MLHSILDRHPDLTRSCIRGACWSTGVPHGPLVSATVPRLFSRRIGYTVTPQFSLASASSSLVRGSASRGWRRRRTAALVRLPHGIRTIQGYYHDVHCRSPCAYAQANASFEAGTSVVLTDMVAAQPRLHRNAQANKARHSLGSQD